MDQFNLPESSITDEIAILKVLVGYGAPLEFRRKVQTAIQSNNGSEQHNDLTFVNYVYGFHNCKEKRLDDFNLELMIEKNTVPFAKSQVPN